MNKYIFGEYRGNDLPYDEAFMASKKIVVFKDSKKDSVIDVGYTYLGQFLAHELVPSTNLFSERFEDKITPEMNLKSIYDYTNKIKLEDVFNINGEFIYEEQESGYPDLNRFKAGKNLNKGIFADMRNNENIIVSQIHLLFQRVHNEILKKISFKENDKLTNKVNIVRTYVVLIFQNIVINEYLPKVCHSDVVNFYKDSKKNLIYSDEFKMDFIPYEFSRAAFRFGHTMVRNKYSIHEKINIKLNFKELFQTKEEEKLLEKHQVLWHALFRKPDCTRCPDKAKKINNHIGSIMGNIPNHSNGINSIISINLDANLKKSIFPASIIEKKIFELYKKHNDDQYVQSLFADIDSNNDIQDLLENYENENGHKMPLWPYILIEAKKHDSDKSDGLGIVGSTIICEVIFESIRVYNSKMKEKKLRIENKIIEQIFPEIGTIADLRMIDLIKLVGE